MAEAQLRVGVDVAQHQFALVGAFAAFVDGLPAAAYATAGAGHNLNEIVLNAAFLDGLAQLMGVFQAAGDADMQLAAGKVERHLAPAFAAAHGAEGIGVGILAGYQEVGAAQRGFHNAAGSAEDVPGARGVAQGHVELLFSQALHVHHAGGQHAAKLARGEHHINIGAGAGGVHVFVGAFCLLGHAGHDGYHGDLARVDLQQFGPVVLGDGAEDLLGRFRGGKVAHQLRVAGLKEAHPPGAARGEHGLAGVLLQVVQQFGAFFHDGHVGREVGVEDVVEAQRAHGGNHAAHRCLFVGKAQRFGPGGADGGRDLGDDDALGVGDKAGNRARVVAGGKRAAGAVRDALAAQRAGGLGNILAAGGPNVGLGAGASGLPHVEVLHLGAHAYAAHAVDALAGIAHQGEVGGAFGMVVFKRIGAVGHVQRHGIVLQKAVAVAHAGSAARAMVRQDERHGFPARGDDARAVGGNHHALGNLVVARGNQLIHPFYLYHADAARAYLVEVFQVAQRGNLRTGHVDSVEDAGVLGDGNGLAVDAKGYHARILPLLGALLPKQLQCGLRRALAAFPFGVA